MDPLITIRGIAAVLARSDVDTDQIFPKQFQLRLLSRTERPGYGAFLFHEWAKDPNFELNRPEYRGAKILITGRNFGCGSSREHAVWALQAAGFDAIIAPSFGDIFRSNALKIGLVPVVLPWEVVNSLHISCAKGPSITLDLRTLEITTPDSVIAFAFDEFERRCIVEGLDDIALTLRNEIAITQYEDAHAAPYDSRGSTQ